MNKKFAALGLTAGLAAGTGMGLVMQSTGTAGAAGIAITATTDPAQPATTAAATATTPGQWITDALAPLVADGTITQAQADKVSTAVSAARPARGGRDGGGRFGGGASLTTVATLLGITEADVRTALEGGQTLAQLAESKGKTAQAVIDALVADATTRINQAVTDGKITQAEADTRLADLATRITDRVNNGGPVGGGHGHGGPNDADADDTATTTPTVATPTTVAGS